MPLYTAALWLLNLLLDTAGQLAFKAAASGGEGWLRMARRPWVWLGIACYCIEFFTWLAFLTLVPLSVAVLLSSVNVVSVMLAGRWLFGERLSPLRSAGMVLIACGVALVGLE